MACGACFRSMKQRPRSSYRRLKRGCCCSSAASVAQCVGSAAQISLSNGHVQQIGRLGEMAGRLGEQGLPCGQGLRVFPFTQQRAYPNRFGTQRRGGAVW